MTLHQALALTAACAAVSGASFAAGDITRKDHSGREVPTVPQPPAGRTLGLSRAVAMPRLVAPPLPARPKPKRSEPAPPPPAAVSARVPSTPPERPPAPAPVPAPVPAPAPAPTPTPAAPPPAPKEFIDSG